MTRTPVAKKHTFTLFRAGYSWRKCPHFYRKAQFKIDTGDLERRERGIWAPEHQALPDLILYDGRSTNTGGKSGGGAQGELIPFSTYNICFAL